MKIYIVKSSYGDECSGVFHDNVAAYLDQSCAEIHALMATKFAEKNGKIPYDQQKINPFDPEDIGKDEYLVEEIEISTEQELEILLKKHEPFLT